MEEKKIGCYFCTGCGIGEALDVKGLASIATQEMRVPVVKNHDYLCGEEGVQMIRDDMANEGVNALVIAACSPRVHVETFRFNTAVMDRVSLREQVVYTQHMLEEDDQEVFEEDCQMMAEDYVRFGCVKVKKMDAPEPFEADGFSKRILVIGGGLSGLTAATEAAETGYEVVLVEKEMHLGGMLNHMHKVSPSKAPYRDIQENPLASLVEMVKKHPKITIYTEAAVKKTSGQPGLFDVDIQVGSKKEVAERIGAIIVATGYHTYDASKLTHLGHGASPDVITSLEFEAMAKAGQIVRRSDGEPAKRVAFSLCAGSRDKDHLAYCSSACCTYSMKHALYVKEQYEDAMTYLIYQEIRTPGQMEDFYRNVQREGGIFIKGDIQKVTRNSQGGLSMAVNDQLLCGSERLDVDLLVLATGMVPDIDTVEPDDASALDEKATAGSVLNLQYRRGPALPHLKWGFPDSHYICFPYETRRTGIYAAGPVRRPMGFAASATDATGAALKAIQAVESVSRGAAVHPRAGDLSYPTFRIEGCTQCKRCTEECPFGAINEDEKDNPLFNPTRCRRCGTCMGACPQKIISFANYSVDMIGSMLKEAEIPDEDEEKPRILILACENDAYPALDMVAHNRGRMNPYIRIIPLRCMGSMSLVWIADAMSAGYDGVLLLGCRHGEDYHCHFMRGSALAEVRLSKVSETLDRLQLESERVKMIEVNIMDADKLPNLLDQFADELEDMGPNPFKEF
ncbi:hydrogenase iron-sulfur subunit [Magnetococcales bacterium HHB-1]